MVRKAAWVLSAKAGLALVALVFAASITLTSTTYQAEVGSSFTVTNKLLATDKGFSVAGSSPASNSTCGSPVTFGATPQTVTNGLTSGHVVYTVQVNTTSLALGSTKYNVTFALGSSSFGPICLQTPLVVIPAQTIKCVFDTNQTVLPASPYTFKVTVQ